MSPAHKAPTQLFTFLTHTHNTSVHTYVIIEVGHVEFLVDDQFFHSEALLLVSVCVIDGLLPQEYRQMPDVSLITEQKPNTNG